MKLVIVLRSKSEIISGPGSENGPCESRIIFSNVWALGLDKELGDVLQPFEF